MDAGEGSYVLGLVGPMGWILIMDTLSGIFGAVTLSLAIVWKMISSVSCCAMVLGLWVILVSAVSTVFAFVVNFHAVAQDANFIWNATWNGILGAVAFDCVGVDFCAAAGAVVQGVQQILWSL